MSNRARPTTPDRTAPRGVGNGEVAQLLALLEADQTGSITIAALREGGIKAPGQAVYDLQLAGYAVERVSCAAPGGGRTLGYRLRSRVAPVLAPSRESGRDRDEPIVEQVS